MGVENVELDPVDTTDVGLPCKVILYNDNVHTFDQVIVQLIKAVGCSREQAENYAMEVHTKGKAAVFGGELVECMKVVSVLEEIALHTEIEM
jgi:ATP-dependent Clp protease adaptor protein ClpS